MVQLVEVMVIFKGPDIKYNPVSYEELKETADRLVKIGEYFAHFSESGLVFEQMEKICANLMTIHEVLTWLDKLTDDGQSTLAEVKEDVERVNTIMRTVGSAHNLYFGEVSTSGQLWRQRGAQAHNDDDDTNGHVFGGFTSLAWASMFTNQWSQDSTVFICTLQTLMVTRPPSFSACSTRLAMLITMVKTIFLHLALAMIYA